MSEPQVDFSKRTHLEGVDKIFTQRWSPRAFKKQDIPHGELALMFEAARWSPSCYNEQPWRFFTSNQSNFDDYLNALVDGNQQWAKNASVLGFVVAKQDFEFNGKPNSFASFDAGAAWMAMSLQASSMGYHTHGMGGVHFDKAHDLLDLDESKFKVVAGFAIGVLADLDSLPEEIRKKEVLTDRKPLSDIWPTG